MLCFALILAALGAQDAEPPAFQAYTEGEDMLVMNAQAGVVLLEDGLILTPGLIGMDVTVTVVATDPPGNVAQSSSETVRLCGSGTYGASPPRMRPARWTRRATISKSRWPQPARSCPTLSR